ncbi:hypothetical protein T09_7404 [Trichinella sp. T9]|nr:hypothetical protein T09_7404 [Trichinella sp. T9]
MHGCNLLSVKTMVVGVPDTAFKKITSSPELLWSFICSGHRDKSCLHHFVLNVASQTSVNTSDAEDEGILFMFRSFCSKCGIRNITLTSSEFDVSPDGLLIGYVMRAHFIHDSITLTSSEFDVFSDGSLTMKLT